MPSLVGSEMCIRDRAIPKPSETQASWQATSEEMTHVIPTTSTATSLSATYGLPNVRPVSTSQSVAPSDPIATKAHSEVIHTPQVPVRSGSSLSTSAEISNSVVKVNPQVSLRESSYQSEQQVQQDTTQFRYQTDQSYNYLQERTHPYHRDMGHLGAQNMTMHGSPTHIRYAHSDAHTLPPIHRICLLYTSPSPRD